MGKGDMVARPSVTGHRAHRPPDLRLHLHEKYTETVPTVKTVPDILRLPHHHHSEQPGRLPAAAKA